MALEDDVIDPSSLQKILLTRKDEVTYCKKLIEVIEKRKQAGMKVDTVIGDTAYSEKANIEAHGRKE